MLGGQIPRPPIQHLFGARLTEVGDGTAVFEMPLTEWLHAPQAAISIGALVIPADAALACAIQTQLPPATPYTTAEISLRLLAPARAGTTVRARGRVVHTKRTIKLSEVELIDSDDRLLAHGSSLCFVLPAISPAPEPPSAPPTTLPPTTEETPDPWRREPLGATLPQDVWDRLSGLEVLGSLLTGELPPPPIQYLTGIHLTSVERGRVTFAMPATEWLAAPPPGRAQGGTVALLAETALSDAIQSMAPAGTAIAPFDLKINYLRPLQVDGREATAAGTVIHAGRRIAIADARVLDADHKAVAVATGSAMILPGRAASLAALEDYAAGV
jgi:uncharacterized protein (TIGR00369 family)